LISLKKIGNGLSCSSNLDAEGELVYVKTVEDVIALFDNAQGKICLVDDAGTTTLGPILSDLAGVVCTSGGPGSHLAIVSREFDLACIMGIKLKKNISEYEGKRVRISTEDDHRGILYLTD
jgi:phosphoenolpyruvate synthase/pyruvate phosphate dikinase